MLSYVGGPACMSSARERSWISEGSEQPGSKEESFLDWESSTFSFMYLRHPEPQSWRKEGSNWKKSQGLEKKGQSNFNEDIQLFLFKVICRLNSNSGIPSEKQLCNVHEIQKPLSL